MIRYMISPVVGDGISMQTPYRAMVADVQGVNTSALIPTHTSGPDIGKPKFSFAMCIVATPQLSFITTVTNSFVFPDYPLDARLDGMEATTRVAMKVNLESYDLDGNGLHFDASNTDAESYREFITRIMQQIEPAATINTFGVQEVSE